MYFKLTFLQDIFINFGSPFICYRNTLHQGILHLLNKNEKIFNYWNIDNQYLTLLWSYWKVLTVLVILKCKWLRNYQKWIFVEFVDKSMTRGINHIYLKQKVLELTLTTLRKTKFFVSDQGHLTLIFKRKWLHLGIFQRTALVTINCTVCLTPCSSFTSPAPQLFLWSESSSMFSASGPSCD